MHGEFQAKIGIVLMALLPITASAQTITQIIDATGDGPGNVLDYPLGVAVDGSGNVYAVIPEEAQIALIHSVSCRCCGVEIAGSFGDWC